jgi:hypothetical protein
MQVSTFRLAKPLPFIDYLSVIQNHYQFSADHRLDFRDGPCSSPSHPQYYLKLSLGEESVKLPCLPEFFTILMYTLVVIRI